MNHWVQVVWPHAFEFSSSFVIDVVIARYNMAVTARRAFAAANWGMLWASIGALGTVIWLNNNWVLITGVIGGWFGSYYAVKYGTKNESEGSHSDGSGQVVPAGDA